MTSTSTDRRQGVNVGAAVKVPSRVATTANVTLSGEQTIDGVAVVTGNRVLVKDQTTGTENGVYVADTGEWELDKDWDGAFDVVEGTLVTVTNGTANADTMWRVTTTGSIVPGTTSLSFERAVVNSSSTVSFLQSGAGAVTRTAQDKMRELVSGFDFYATGDGTTNDAAEIQAALDSLATIGGIVTLTRPTVSYNLGTIGLTVTDNVTLRGESSTMGAAGGGGDGGTILKYSGTGDAIRCNGVKAVVLQDLVIDGSGTTGAAAVGIAMRGAWGCTLRRISVTGITPAKGYGIHFRTLKADASAWGAQHNYLEMCECADGIVRFDGESGADSVTTTVVNTFRGSQYEIDNALVNFINATAERSGTAATGFAFSGTGFSTMIGCDIEGAYTTGIAITDTHEVRHLGTIWAGFTGTTRITGSMGLHETFGGAIALSKPGVIVADEFPSLKFGQVQGTGVADFVECTAVANNVTGGAQDGHQIWYRRKAGSRIKQAQFQNYLRIEHTVSIANVATTVLTIPIATNKGLFVTAHAEGIETGAGAFSCYRDTLAVNGAGTVTKSDGTEREIAAGGAAPAFTFTVSTTNILVQFNHASATPTNINFVIEIDGPVVSYTLG